MWFDLVNQKFGNLTVIKLLPKRYLGKERVWLCKCICGRYRKVLTGLLRAKRVTNCGCLHGGLKVNEGLWNRVYEKYVYTAKKRNLNFALTKEQCIKLFNENCYYCGRSPFTIMTYISLRGKILYNGIDRINNKQGYTLKNSVTCCKICNYAKGEMTLKDFKQWIIKVNKHLICKEDIK